MSPEMVRTAIRDRVATAPTTPTMFVGSAERGDTGGHLVSGTRADALAASLSAASALISHHFRPSTTQGARLRP